MFRPCLQVEESIIRSQAVTMSMVLGNFSEIVIKFGVHRCQTYHSVFHLHNDTVYEYDIIFTRNGYEYSTRLKLSLPHYFHTNDLGILQYFLEIEVARYR